MLECTLEEMNRQIPFIEPKFFAGRMRTLNLERRDRQREINLEQKARDQAVKNQQMLARALSPPKRSDGRRLVMRVLPQASAGRDTDAEAEEQLERERLDALLYGPVFA